MSRILYELVGKDDRRYSPYCWRIRFALAHKELSTEYEPCCHNETEKLAFSGQSKIPVLVDGKNVISDSWQIACFLDDTYPDQPLLMDGAQSRAFTRFINIWTDTILGPPLLRTLLLEIYNNLHPAVDREHYRRTREARFGRTLEELHQRSRANIEEFNRSLGPIRDILRLQPWISGSAPAYADYIVFGEFQFARCLTRLKLLGDGDPVYEWQTRMIKLYDGLANKVPTFDS